MMMDDAQENSQDLSILLETQQATQETQQASQPNPGIDSHLWGYLQPCSASLTRIDFWKIKPRYLLGRNIELNDVVLPGSKVSNQHCTISWDGAEDRTSSVVVLDLSSNGTFINGTKIGRNQTRILREGNELAFGTATPQPHNGLEDYRFVYRHTAAGLPTEGLYAYYDISTELGKGSFATVMKAVSRATGEWFAVKMIKDSKNLRGGETAGNNTNAARTSSFAREISIMEKLKHPNICELKEVFFQENNDINLVLELVEGGDLLDYILSRNGLTEPQAQHITYQMCQALAYIHDQGVAHRDLKPENILLTTDDPPMVKVADFGLAKAVDSLTMLRTMCGTPSYLAPEVVKQENHEGYDNLVDSWSVGVIVFSMLTNASPFIEDENQRDIRTRIAERQIDWGTLVNANVSLQAQDFIRRLLDMDPALRMTLADALYHPWLQSYTPVYDHRPFSATPSVSSIPTGDVSMLSSGPESDRSFGSGADVPGAFPGWNGIKPEGSRTAPLQRRSQVLSQAAEGQGAAPVEPSWEMIAHASSQAQSQAVAGPSNWAVNKGNKRVHSELTPLSELDDDADMNGPSPSSNSNISPHKKGKNDLDDESLEIAGRSARAKGKAATEAVAGPAAKARVLRARAGAKGEANGEGDNGLNLRLRRSNRQLPGKAARRA